MKWTQLHIPELVVMEPNVYTDERGWFMESYNERGFFQGLTNLGLIPPKKLVQDNHSSSQKGVLRGLHFQLAPYAQGKLVRVLRGAIYDVAVDIRHASPSFGQSVSIVLSEENKKIFWIPEGFAHGFMALEDNTHVMYKVTRYYNPSFERSLHWADPKLDIPWPKHLSPILNVKDAEAPSFDEIKNDMF